MKNFKIKYPITILLVCAFEIFGIISIPSSIKDDFAQNIGLWYQGYILINGLVSALIIYFLFRLKKVGIFLYFSVYLIHNVIALFVGNWLIFLLLIPLIAGVCILPFYKKFD